jgi:hypothetical protein
VAPCWSLATAWEYAIRLASRYAARNCGSFIQRMSVRVEIRELSVNLRRGRSVVNYGGSLLLVHVHKHGVHGVADAVAEVVTDNAYPVEPGD